MKNEINLKQLSRQELVELLILEKKKNELLKQKLFKTENKLNDREIQFEQIGNLAEIAAKVSGILEAAQQTADLYLENIRGNYEEGN